ncbi:MAG TPA: tetratricopeptide repeat protein [Actinomycetota bacterium]|nr:tetratricopeptide repeat protein [Actinomycetota bacterium]
MSWVVLLAAAVLAGVAAGGVLRPFGSPRRAVLERLADPLEDERASLLRSLRELEEERARGELSDATYRSLRSETESRAVTVLHALEAREGAGELTSGLRALRAAPSGDGARRGAGSRRRVLSAVLIGTAVLGLSIPLLARAVSNRTSGEPITGFAQGSSGGAANPLALFERRVAEHPQDLAARLDLADRYMAAGNAAGAAEQYLVALQLDPRNAEAQAKLGFLLYQGGRAEEGLQAVDRALAVDPSYPEALYYEGVILLRALGRPGEAAAAFRSYLESAPFGARRTEVQRLLAEAERSS